MSTPIFLAQKLDTKKVSLEGKLEGIGYTGAPIPSYGFWENFIVDLSTLEIERDKLPILRDHQASQVAGFGKATVEDNKLLVDAQLSQKTSHGAEIVALAADGFEWEMSMGIFEGDIEEITEDTVVNGYTLDRGFVLRNGLLREVSVVAIGADRDTIANIFSQNKGEKKPMEIKLSKEQWTRLACACGGHKDSTPEEVETKANEGKKLAEDDKKKIDDLTSELETLKKQIADKQAEIDAIKGKEEMSAREAKIQAAVKEKNIEFSAEKITEAAKTEEKTAILLSFIGEMKAQEKKIDAKLSGKQNLGGSNSAAAAGKDAEAIRLQADKMVKDGEAADFLEAMNKIEEK